LAFQRLPDARTAVVSTKRSLAARIPSARTTMVTKSALNGWVLGFSSCPWRGLTRPLPQEDAASAPHLTEMDLGLATKLPLTRLRDREAFPGEAPLVPSPFFLFLSLFPSFFPFPLPSSFFLFFSKGVRLYAPGLIRVVDTRSTYSPGDAPPPRSKRQQPPQKWQRSGVSGGAAGVAASW